MSIRLGTSRGFCRRANERRNRVVSAAAKAATPQRVENGQVRRRRARPVQAKKRGPTKIAQRNDAPLGRSALTDPARAPAYVARAPFAGRLRLSADGGSVEGHSRTSRAQVFEYRCVQAPMRPRFLLVAGLMVAAVLTTLLTVQPFRASSAPSVAALAQRDSGEAGESAAEVQKELLDPADALLARNLFGADKNVGPGKFWAAAAAQAAQIGTDTRSLDPAAAKAAWQLVGPTSVGGRVLDVVVDPNHADTVFIATASGGVWKSSDAGTTFTPAWPAKLTQAIGAL